MELNSEQANAYEKLSQKEFAAKKSNISLSALDYAMDNNMIDFIRMGTIRYVVLTPRTELYTPAKRAGKKRNIMHT